MPFGLDIIPTTSPLGFQYGENCFGPAVEIRKLNNIRQSLLNQNCSGPEDVYAIAMDVGKKQHKEILEERMLLYGVVTYAAGKLGSEPVRSQGHIHKVSFHSGWSPPEVYEIWHGSAIIYMQQYANDNPGKCYAVHAKVGDVIIVPPSWAHATISADVSTPLTFGAWCDREYGFEYDEIKKRHGLAWYPVVDNDNSISWHPNQNYQTSKLIKKIPNDYSSLFDIKSDKPIYSQFEDDEERFQFVSNPEIKKSVWENFIP